MPNFFFKKESKKNNYKKEDTGADKEEEEVEDENTDTSIEDEENSLNEFLYYLANLSKALTKDVEVFFERKKKSVFFTFFIFFVFKFVLAFLSKLMVSFDF